MRALTIAWVAMAILTAGALFAGAEEEGSQCSAALRGGADACQATCGAGQTAVCKADGSRVGCFCRDASSEKSGDDHKGHDDGDGEHDEHDGHGDGGDDDGDREHGEHDGHGDGGDDDGDASTTVTGTAGTMAAARAATTMKANPEPPAMAPTALKTDGVQTLAQRVTPVERRHE